jgi:hypothetical protein
LTQPRPQRSGDGPAEPPTPQLPEIPEIPETVVPHPTPEPTTLTEHAMDARPEPAAEASTLADALPLWAEPDESTPTTTALADAEPSVGPLGEAAHQAEIEDVVIAFRTLVGAAWSDHVPPDRGTADDLSAALDGELRTLQQRWESTVPSPQRHGPTPAATAPPGRSATRDAAAVNDALHQADAHAARLQDFPEWQELQTVRGAARNLWNALRQRAGEYFDRLVDDRRFQTFWREVSVRTCEKIASWATAAADRLRNGPVEGARPDPAAQALRNLGDAATAYAGPRRVPPASDPSGPGVVNIPELRKMGSALQKPTTNGRETAQGPRVSAAAAKSRSTTPAKGKKPTPAAGEQAPHLRRGPASAQQGHTPHHR